MIVFLDSNVLIYLIEGDGHLAAKVKQAIISEFEACSDAVLAISALTILECRVLPLRRNDNLLLRRYDDFFQAAGLLQVELTRPVLERAAKIRAHSRLKTPDALQAACCLSLEGPHVFLCGGWRVQESRGTQCR